MDTNAKIVLFWFGFFYYYYLDNLPPVCAWSRAFCIFSKHEPCFNLQPVSLWSEKLNCPSRNEFKWFLVVFFNVCAVWLKWTNLQHLSSPMMKTLLGFKSSKYYRLFQSRKWDCETAPLFLSAINDNKKQISNSATLLFMWCLLFCF